MQAAWLLLFFFSQAVGQATTAGPTCGCHPCKEITAGANAGSYNLVEEVGAGRCGSSCLYRKDNATEDDPMYWACMCEPGDLEVETSCRDPVRPAHHELAALEPHPHDHKFVLGMYILLADDNNERYHTNAAWHPRLHKYQQDGSNALFCTFINPATMDVPISFQNLAATKGKGTDGAVPAATLIIFVIGGAVYSTDPNPWEWLTSQDTAEAMAVRVAEWQDDYKIDGIDLDIEKGAGDQYGVGPNMVHFIRKLKELKPGFLVTQPTFGYPQVSAEIDVINASWDVDGTSNRLADSVGIMVYEGTQALQYVDDYAEAASASQGFPIKVNVPQKQILVGCKGSASAATIDTLAKESVSEDLLGIMVWYCSVRGGITLGPDGWPDQTDGSGSQDSMDAYVAAMKYFRTQ